MLLLLSIFLLSGCFSGSMGSAIKEFEENFKALVGLASKETFLLVPKGKFQCSRVPCHLGRTIEQLKVSFKNSQMKTHVSLMENNMDHIISTLNKARARPETRGSCLMAELSPQDALRHYQKFFQKLQEMC